MSDHPFVSELISRGIDPAAASRIDNLISQAQARGQPSEAWREISRRLLAPGDDFAIHEAVYDRCYGTNHASHPTGPAWLPTPDEIAASNIASALAELGQGAYPQLHRWSVDVRQDFWRWVIRKLQIRFAQRYVQILANSRPTHSRWLIGARLNIAESCFGGAEDAPAIVFGRLGDAPRTWTRGELRRLANRVAHSLLDLGIAPGDAVAIVMPMTPEAVAIYLGIILAGAAVISIAESFSPEEISARMRLGGARLVFTQDFILRGAKRIALYDRVVKAHGPPAIVLPAGDHLGPALRHCDRGWNEFLKPREQFTAVTRSAQDAINILFSSGTTGDPKAIPWDHTTPIKCASDAFFHHDLHPGDVVAWPTSLGWMMGPWLVFGAMMNRAAIALTDQPPAKRGFGQFIQQARVTMLGLVPSLVRAWRQSGCMKGLDWSSIHAFSSTGECSNPRDMLYLMHLAGYKPVIEYCGGTEIGGGYITGTVVQPCIPATFTTPAMGLDFVILDENRRPARRGEVFLVGPSIGLSSRLLNRDHHAAYFEGAPAGPTGLPLRRHGDEIEALANGCFKVLGRCDDTMNLGGIKVGCAEIERVVNLVPGVRESAAVAVPPPDGGPSMLVIFIALEAGAAGPEEELRRAIDEAIRRHLNPLFKLHDVRIVPRLPRTASNKILRRELRAQYRPPGPTPEKGHAPADKPWRGQDEPAARATSRTTSKEKTPGR